MNKLTWPRSDFRNNVTVIFDNPNLLHKNETAGFQVDPKQNCVQYNYGVSSQKINHTQNPSDNISPCIYKFADMVRVYQGDQGKNSEAYRHGTEIG